MDDVKKLWGFILASLLVLGGCQESPPEIETESVAVSNAKQVTVVNYHQFGNIPDEYPTIENIRSSEADFREQMQRLVDDGYTTLTLKEFIDYINGEQAVPEKSVLITIDDGFESTYHIAYPILAELGLSATLFPIMSEQEIGFRKGVPMLTDAQLIELAESDVFDIGNHTYDLHWRGENDTVGHEAMVWGVNREGHMMTDAERKQWIKADLLKSSQKIKELIDIDVTAISYPYGAYDEIVLEAVEELGYEVGFTVNEGAATYGEGKNNPYIVNRTGMKHYISTDEMFAKLERFQQEIE